MIATVSGYEGKENKCPPLHFFVVEDCELSHFRQEYCENYLYTHKELKLDTKVWVYATGARTSYGSTFDSLEIPVEWEKTAQFKKAVIQLRILEMVKWTIVRKICRS